MKWTRVVASAVAFSHSPVARVAMVWGAMAMCFGVWPATHTLAALCVLGTAAAVTTTAQHVHSSNKVATPQKPQTESGGHTGVAVTPTAAVGPAAATPKLHWGDVVDTLALAARVPSLRLAAAVVAGLLLLGWTPAQLVTVGVVLATTAGLVAVTRCPGLETAHVFVDVSNISIPLASRSKRIDFAGLRHAVLRPRKTSLAWVALASVARRYGLQELADTLVTRHAGKMYVCGSARPDVAEPAWCANARAAGFTVTQLKRVRKASGYTGEETVDDVLHKAMANTALRVATGRLAGLRRVARFLGVASRQTLVQASGDGNDNGGANAGHRGGFPQQLRLALQAHMNVEVWSWKACLSGRYLEMVAAHGNDPWATTTLSVVHLDDFAPEVAVAAPACRYGSRCTRKERCSFTHPAVEARPPSPVVAAVATDHVEDGADGSPTVEVGAGAGAQLQTKTATETRSRSGSDASTNSKGSTVTSVSTNSNNDQAPASRPEGTVPCTSKMPEVIVSAGPTPGSSWGRGARRASPTALLPTPGSYRRHTVPAVSAPTSAAAHASSRSRSRSPPSAVTRQSSAGSRPWRSTHSHGGHSHSHSHSHASARSSADYLTRFETPCRYGIRCTLRKCGYQHPPGWKRQALLPTDVIRHAGRPTYKSNATVAGGSKTNATPAPRGFRPVECRYGLRCTSSSCGFSHPAGWERPEYAGTSKRRGSSRQGSPPGFGGVSSGSPPGFGGYPGWRGRDCSPTVVYRQQGHVGSPRASAASYLATFGNQF